MVPPNRNVYGMLIPPRYGDPSPYWTQNFYSIHLCHVSKIWGESTYWRSGWWFQAFKRRISKKWWENHRNTWENPLSLEIFWCENHPILHPPRHEWLHKLNSDHRSDPSKFNDGKVIFQTFGVLDSRSILGPTPYFWVNYNISLPWFVRPFGDDFPIHSPWFPGFGRTVRSWWNLPSNILAGEHTYHTSIISRHHMVAFQPAAQLGPKKTKHQGTPRCGSPWAGINPRDSEGRFSLKNMR